MQFDEALKNKESIRETLAQYLRETCRLPGLRVSMGVLMDDAGEAEYSVVLCDLTDPRRMVPEATLFAAKLKIQSLCPGASPHVRGVMVPGDYLPETRVE